MGGFLDLFEVLGVLFGLGRTLGSAWMSKGVRWTFFGSQSRLFGLLLAIKGTPLHAFWVPEVDYWAEGGFSFAVPPSPVGTCPEAA